jgi:hypothetical protein
MKYWDRCRDLPTGKRGIYAELGPIQPVPAPLNYGFIRQQERLALAPWAEELLRHHRCARQ